MPEQQNQSHRDVDLALMIGQLQGTLKGIESTIQSLDRKVGENISQTNSALDGISTKVRHHETLFQKGAAIVATITFIVSMVWVFIGEWVKDKIFHI